MLRFETGRGGSGRPGDGGAPLRLPGGFRAGRPGGLARAARRRRPERGPRRPGGARLAPPRGEVHGARRALPRPHRETGDGHGETPRRRGPHRGPGLGGGAHSGERAEPPRSLQPRGHGARFGARRRSRRAAGRPLADPAGTARRGDRARDAGSAAGFGRSEGDRAPPGDSGEGGGLVGHRRRESGGGLPRPRRRPHPRGQPRVARRTGGCGALEPVAGALRQERPAAGGNPGRAPGPAGGDAAAAGVRARPPRCPWRSAPAGLPGRGAAARRGPEEHRPRSEARRA